MGTNTTGTSVSSGEMEVKTVKNSDVEAEKMKNGYGSAVFTAVEMAPLLDNYKESSDPNASGDSGNNSTKKSDYLIIWRGITPICGHKYSDKKFEKSA